MSEAFAKFYAGMTGIAVGILAIGILAVACAPPSETGATSAPRSGRTLVMQRFEAQRVTCFYLADNTRPDWPVALDCLRDQ